MTALPARSTSSSELDQEVYALQQLDLDIEGLEKQLQAAQKKRIDLELQSRVDFLRASQAPIRKVPREVLDMIFDKNQTDQEERNASLMLVCKVWREIVLDSPRLWNTIVLNLESIETVCSRWRYTVDCLERSGSSPLNIYIDARTFTPPSVPITPAMDLFEEITGDYPQSENVDTKISDMGLVDNTNCYIFSAIFIMTVTILRGREGKFMSRWNSLHVDIEGPRLGHFRIEFWDDIKGITDHLVHLHFIGISDVRTRYHQANDWTPVGFPSLMSLEYLTTDIPSEYLNRVNLPTTLKQLSLLTWLYVDHLSTIDTARFPALTILELQIIRSQTENGTKPRATLELPLLQMLALSGDGHADALASFNTPKLTHLSVVCYSHIRYQTTPALAGITDLLWDGSSINDRNVLRSLIVSSPKLLNLHVWRGAPSTLPVVQEMMASFATEGITSAGYRNNSTDWPTQFIPRIY